MMNAHIARLDRSLRKNGEDIILRRVVGATNQQNTDVNVRAHVSGPSEEQLIAGIDQNTFNCIFSPTEINAQQWPGGQPPNTTLDPRIPSKNRGDKAYVRGGWRAVQWATGFYPGGELVRIEMRVLG
jgi:hypothetical protein